MFVSKLVADSPQESHGCETEKEAQVSVSSFSAGQSSRDS